MGIEVANSRVLMLRSEFTQPLCSDGHMLVSGKQCSMSVLVHLLRSSLTLQEVNHLPNGFFALGV